MKLNMGDKLKRKRLLKGLTQSELGKLLHVDARTISSWETNRTEPKKEQIEKLSEILNCTVKDLTGYSSTITMDLQAPDAKGVWELYNSLNSEQQLDVLLHMIDLKWGGENGDCEED